MSPGVGQPRVEQELTRAVLDALRKLPGVKAWRNNTGRRGHIVFGEVGSPDVMCVVAPHGTFVGIELKMPGKQATPEQAAWLARIGEVGGMTVVATTLQDALAPVLWLLANGRTP